ncbi:MAG: hypothetical protein PQJ46_07460, partial [Spirochaetales bacterium]|nr:hypothetical protein [Spirochaetales bacterium]
KENIEDYRPMGKEGAELYSFIRSRMEMSGDLVDNIYKSVNDIINKNSEDRKLQMPEKTLKMYSADNTDIALLYYDILKRCGYKVHFYVIDYGDIAGNIYCTTAFREKEADVWGWIDANGLERERAKNIQRIPALVLSASVDYFEPDMDELFQKKVIIFPPPSKWTKSLY